MTKSFTKLKHQVKSSRYYIFWGAATIAVMAGQIYVGNGYRKMSESVGELTEIIETQNGTGIVREKKKSIWNYAINVN